jgi:DNA-binding transcriptional LysR family regulator
VRVEGQLVFNGAAGLLNAALNGFGLAYLMEGHAQEHIAKGRLVRVLSDWCNRSPAIIRIIRAAASLRPRFPCWSMRCDTGAEQAAAAFRSHRFA